MAHPSVTVKTLRVQFDTLRLSHRKVRQMRSEIIEMTQRHDDRFHNRTPEGGYLYRYPLVQYRASQGQATLFGLQEGVAAIDQLVGCLEGLSYTLRRETTEVALTAKPLPYRLHHWLPFNEPNWQRWQACTTLRQRLELLESLLTGQLLGFCEAIGYQVPNRGLRVELLDYRQLAPQHYQGSHTNGPLQLAGIDAIYQANLRLPDHMALGKGKSKGFGWQVATSHTQLPTRPDRRGKQASKGAVWIEDQ